MEVLKDIFQYILDFGAPVFVPLIMFVIGMITKMKVRDAFQAALTLGIAFTGMSLLIGFMMETVGGAAGEMATNTGLVLSAVDGGWPGMASISWAWPYAFIMFPLTIGVNIIMLSIGWTKTLNVDMWNVWNKIFTAVMVSFISGNIYLGFLAATIQIALELKIGDLWQPTIEKMTGIPGVTVPHLVTLIAVVLNPIDKVLNKIPGINKKFDSDALKEKIGIFGENHVMGGLIGLGLGLAAGKGLQGALILAVQAATAMMLFPMISKLFSQALSPISQGVSEFMRKKFAGKEVYIGLDWPILAGQNELWVAVIFTIPALLIFSFILPGNNVLPFAGIINLSFVVGALLLTKGNLIKMIIMGVVTAPLFLYGATFAAPYITKLATQTGVVQVAAGKMITWSTFEAPDFRIIFSKMATGDPLYIGLAVVWVILCVWLFKTLKARNAKLEQVEA